jgi:uncharacterized protein YbjT (DUF2867 family)
LDGRREKGWNAMKTVLVTGSTGNVGRAVVHELLRLGVPTRAALLSANLQEVDGAPAVPFNFRDAATWSAALDGVGGIFLMRPPEIADVDQTLVPFLNAARQAGVEQISFLSLIGVDKNKKIPHYAVEQALLQAGMGYTFVRPGFFMQNATGAYRDDIRFRNQIIVPAAKGKLAFIDTRDIGAVAAKTLAEPGHAGKIYSITGSEALNFHQVAQIISQAVGRTITYTQPSAAEFRTHQRRVGAPEEFIAVMNGIYFPVRMGWAAGITQEFATLMGRPPIRFEQFAIDNAAAWSLPSAEERASYEAKLATLPPVQKEGWWARLTGRFGGGPAGTIRV